MKSNNTKYHRQNGLLSLFITAGFPKLDSTVEVLSLLEKNEVEQIEIGMPYSDPIADGKTIQDANTIALKNGMNLNILFNQLKQLPSSFSSKLILMGYFNQVLQCGIDTFLERCQNCKVSGVILPDLPPEVYESKYKRIFEKYEIEISFLVTPQTSDDRVHYLDSLSTGFLYAVSNATTTGKRTDFNTNQMLYFKRLKQLQCSNLKLIGFGIHTAEHFKIASEYTNGAIIGSAFINAIKNATDLEHTVSSFIQTIRS